MDHPDTATRISHPHGRGAAVAPSPAGIDVRHERHASQRTQRDPADPPSTTLTASLSAARAIHPRDLRMDPGDQVPGVIVVLVLAGEPASDLAALVIEHLLPQTDPLQRRAAVREHCEHDHPGGRVTPAERPHAEDACPRRRCRRSSRNALATAPGFWDYNFHP